MPKKKSIGLIDKYYQKYVTLVLIVAIILIGIVIFNSDKIISQQEENIAGKGFLDRLRGSRSSPEEPAQQQEGEAPSPGPKRGGADSRVESENVECEGVQENEVEEKVLDILEAYGFVRKYPYEADWVTEQKLEETLLNVLNSHNYVNEVSTIFRSSEDIWLNPNSDCSDKCEAEGKKCIFTIGGRSLDGDNDKINYDEDRLTYLGLCSEGTPNGVSRYRQWCVCSN